MSLLSPFAAELVGLGCALAFAQAWFFDIVTLHCLRLTLTQVHSACCICAFMLGVEIDLAVLFILVVFTIEISLSSTLLGLFSSLVKLLHWSHLLQPFQSLQSHQTMHLPVLPARPSSTHAESCH